MTFEYEDFFDYGCFAVVLSFVIDSKKEAILLLTITLSSLGNILVVDHRRTLSTLEVDNP